MATIKVDDHGAATITMANGRVAPVPPNYDSMTLGSRACPELITWPDGGEWITYYSLLLIDGLADDLADGETFTSSHDGTTWTRYGAEMLAVTPLRFKVVA
jgi:hypothetical protein